MSLVSVGINRENLGTSQNQAGLISTYNERVESTSRLSHAKRFLNSDKMQCPYIRITTKKGISRMVRLKLNLNSIKCLQDIEAKTIQSYLFYRFTATKKDSQKDFQMILLRMQRLCNYFRYQ